MLWYKESSLHAHCNSSMNDGRYEYDLLHKIHGPKFNTNLSLNSILLVLNLTNVILHSFGIYLLKIVCKRFKKTEQLVFLAHLSIAESLMNFIELIRRILDFLWIYDIRSHVIIEAHHYLQIVSLTGISFVFYMEMLYITFDRLVSILMNVYYPLYWNVTKTRYLLYATWLVGAILCVTICVTHYILHFNWRMPTFTYFYPIVDVLFIILSIITYTLIFYKYWKSAKKIGANKNTPGVLQSKQSGFTFFRKSRFYIPVLLITTFFLFTASSDLIYLSYVRLVGKESETLLVVCWILYAVSNLIDVLIYIFMHHRVKTVLKEKVQRWCKIVFKNC